VTLLQVIKCERTYTSQVEHYYINVRLFIITQMITNYVSGEIKSLAKAV